VDDDEFGERLRALDRRNKAFVDHLEVLDRRDTALLQATGMAPPPSRRRPPADRG